MRVIIGEGIIDINKCFYHVKKFTNGKLKKGYAYMFEDGLVLPYMGKINDYILSADVPPGVYKRGHDTAFIFPRSDKEALKYSEENIREINIDKIFKRITESKDKIPTLKDIEASNNNAEITKPLINEDDDFLKKAIKEVILNKEINLKNYADKFKTPHDRTNKMGALVKNTKMSVNYFTDWCEILGVNYKLTLVDSGNDVNSPLTTEITVSN